MGGIRISERVLLPIISKKIDRVDRHLSHTLVRMVQTFLEFESICDHLIGRRKAMWVSILDVPFAMPWMLQIESTFGDKPPCVFKEGIWSVEDSVQYRLWCYACCANSSTKTGMTFTHKRLLKRARFCEQVEREIFVKDLAYFLAPRTKSTEDAACLRVEKSVDRATEMEGNWSSLHDIVFVQCERQPNDLYIIGSM